MIRSKVHRFGTIQMLALLGLLAIGLTASTAGPALAPNSNTGGMLLAAAQKTGFQALGQMPGAAAGFGTFASGISGDGSTIVGYASVCPNGQSKCTSTDKTEAYRWTVAAGYQVLGDLGSSIGSSASATSSDGSIVVGEAPVGGNSFGAFRWTAAEGMVALPLPMIFANAVTADGRMVAGGDHWWNTSGQTGTFGPFPGQQDQTAAYGLSADGGVAVGAAINGADAFGPTFNAFLWTPAGGLQDIGVPGVGSDADAVSADASVIVGEHQVSGFWRAFVWTASTGMQDIGTLGGPESRALAANQDGSVIVGTSLTSQLSDSNHAFRWTAKTGMQDLQKLVNVPGNWILSTAVGVSADGTVITGYGLNPKLVWEPFRIVLP
jgi:probable HAF family extracellular repeat protein